MTDPLAFPQAPEIAVSRWFNTDVPLTLAGLRGQVVMLHAFQMLCAGCVMQATPSTLLIDRAGRLRHHRFGMDTDEALAHAIAGLLDER